MRGLRNIPRLQTVCEVLMLNWVAPQSTPTTHSSLEEGRGMHGLESNPGSSLQTEEEAGLP